MARTHTNSMAKAHVFNTKIVSDTVFGDIDMNRALVNNLIIRMFIYSAMKIMANKPPLYSMLNPETSSDSPSAKSNGVRFVSAKFVINHVIAKGISINEAHVLEDILVKSTHIIKIKTLNKISDILTSYEIVCATPRNAPRSAYFELDLHPAINVVYTFILDTQRKYRTLYCIKNDW